MNTKKFVDMHNLSEDDRIDMIGAQVTAGSVVGVMVEDSNGKPERYIRKVLKKFPRVEVADQIPGPVANVVTIKFRIAQN